MGIYTKDKSVSLVLSCLITYTAGLNTMISLLVSSQ